MWAGPTCGPDNLHPSPSPICSPRAMSSDRTQQRAQPRFAAPAVPARAPRARLAVGAASRNVPSGARLVAVRRSARLLGACVPPTQTTVGAVAGAAAAAAEDDSGLCSLCCCEPLNRRFSACGHGSCAGCADRLLVAARARVRRPPAQRVRLQRGWPRGSQGCARASGLWSVSGARPPAPA